MKKVLLVSTLLVLVLTSATARQREPVFISASGGCNLTLENLVGAFTKKEAMYWGIQYAFNGNFGVWATDCVGFGAGFNGFWLKNDLPSFPNDGIPLKYVYGTFYWDLTNTVYGYNPQKRVNFVTYFTFGANICDNTRFVAGWGLSMPINLGVHFAFVPDIQVIGIPDTVYGGGNTGIFAVIVPSFGIRVSF